MAVRPSSRPTGLTPDQLVAKCSQSDLSERAASQQYFIDLCHLLDQPGPARNEPLNDGKSRTFYASKERLVNASRQAMLECGFKIDDEVPADASTTVLIGENAISA